jgi:hypothetical protein
LLDDKKRILKIKLPDIILLSLLIFITVNRYYLQQDYTFSLGYYEFLGLSVIYFIIRTIEPAMYLYLLISIIIGGIIQCIHGNLQLYGYLPSNHNLFNITGSFFNPGPYAGYLISVLPIAAGIYFNREICLEIIGSG